MNAELFARACGVDPGIAAHWFGPVSAAMAEYGIDTPLRQAAFLAQIGHESAGFTRTREKWGPTPAQQRYEGRLDLGNTQTGDGSRFRGRGLIQLTGRANYRTYGDALKVDLVQFPHLLATTGLAARSAALFWKSRGLNELADAGNFERITKRINGGTNGMEDRQRRYRNALEALNA